MCHLCHCPVATVKGAVVIDQIADSELHCVLCNLTMSWLIENERPKMRDLNRYVTKKYASDWEDIGVELGLELDALRLLEEITLCKAQLV